jgi:prolyl-tRNA synthetase
MLQSQLFTKTRREAPKDEVAKNAQLLIRGGYIDKVAAGVYSYLPLGLKVLRKIEHIIREEMNAVGGQEVFMPSFHPKELWEKTGRWGTMDDLYKVSDSSGREVALGPTHEEVVTPLAGSFISSYRDLPFSVYQFQNKFRMELRAKSGILRGREFIMKDLYSFHRDEADLSRYYETMKEAYLRVFARAGIGERTFFTYASGGSFSKYSHEFQMLTPAGEDVISICEKCRVAVNREIVEENGRKCPVCGASLVRDEKSIEVGNIFELKTKFSSAFGLTYKDEQGKDQPVQMGCYGIGLGRLMGSVVEAFADERGIVWPEEIAPFPVHVLALSPGDPAADTQLEEVLNVCAEKGIEPLIDDRSDATAGEKFADADLLGIPHRVVVSKKTAVAGKVEYRQRSTSEAIMLDLHALFSKIGRD